MEQRLQQEINRRVQALLDRDSRRADPVVQSVSLFFWTNLNMWVRRIAFVPEPFTIALTGASGSGKSFIREILVHRLSEVSQVASFTQDNYYRDFETDFPHLPLGLFYDEINLDDPAHIRFRELGRDIRRIQQASFGSRIKIPKLRFGTPTTKPTIIEGGLEIPISPFIVTEGIHAFYDPTILPFYHLKIFVDIDEKTRRKRWLDRNRRENRGTTDNMWQTTVECLHQFILPTRQVADLVINNNASQESVVSFLEDVLSALSDTAHAIRGDIREIA